MKNKFREMLLCTGLAACIAGCAAYPSSGNTGVSGVEGGAVQNRDHTVAYDGIATGDVSAPGVAVHDPSILKAEGSYYLFGTHMTAAISDDLTHWRMIADGYSKTNPVYGQIYEVADQSFAWAGSRESIIRTDDGKTHVWAPHVIYNKAMGKYCMYGCTSSTWNASNLYLATADAPEGPYIWQKALICSGFNYGNMKETDVLHFVEEDHARRHYIKNGGYNYDDYPNAIDPTAFYDAEGRLWLVYGSWSGGIFLIELDEETGDVIHPETDEENGVDAYFGRRLLGGGHISIEGPYILYDEATEYYYMFVSYGALQSNGGYQIRVFRSKEVEGPYEDMKGERPGKSAMHKDFGLKLSGNYKLPSLEKAYMATGHNSAFIDDDGKRYVVYHTRFNDGGETHSPRVHQYVLNEEGWPCMLPYQTDGETVSDTGYERAAVTGRYFVVNQGTEISNAVANPVILYLDEDGTVEGRESSGIWEMQEGTPYISITIDGIVYRGVFCRMKDEAGTEVMTWSAVGENTTVWGVKYG